MDVVVMMAANGFRVRVTPPDILYPLNGDWFKLRNKDYKPLGASRNARNEIYI